MLEAQRKLLVKNNVAAKTRKVRLIKPSGEKHSRQRGLWWQTPRGEQDGTQQCINKNWVWDGDGLRMTSPGPLHGQLCQDVTLHQLI